MMDVANDGYRLHNIMVLSFQIKCLNTIIGFVPVRFHYMDYQPPLFSQLYGCHRSFINFF